MIKFSTHLGESFYYEPLNETQLKYDIKKRYDYFNSKLFEGKLPTDFKLRFSRSKKVGGSVITEYWVKGRGAYKRVTDWRIKELILSTFHLRTDEQLDSILVHEMIHVWLTVNGKHEGYNVKLHGPEFVAKMGELQSKVPFKISLYDTPDMRGDVNHKAKMKALGVVMTLADGKPDSIIVFTEKTLRDNLEKLKDILIKNLGTGIDIMLGTSQHPSLEQFTIKRSISKMSLYKLSDDMYDNIKSDFSEFERFATSGVLDKKKQKEVLTDLLFSKTMKMARLKPGNKTYETLKLEINELRKELGMELIDFK
jgi:hypothetical protein